MKHEFLSQIGKRELGKRREARGSGAYVPLRILLDTPSTSLLNNLRRK